MIILILLPNFIKINTTIIDFLNTGYYNYYTLCPSYNIKLLSNNHQIIVSAPKDDFTKYLDTNKYKFIPYSYQRADKVEGLKKELIYQCIDDESGLN